LGGRKGIQPVKTEWWGTGMVVCLKLGANLHMAQLMSLPLTVSRFSKIQIGFTFLVLAYPGSPGKRAVKRVCVCVDFLYQEAFLATYRTFIDPSLLIKKLLYRYSELSTSSDGQKRKLANNTFSLLVRVVNELW